jgi:hypothetical protein
MNLEKYNKGERGDHKYKVSPGAFGLRVLVARLEEGGCFAWLHMRSFMCLFYEYT